MELRKFATQGDVSLLTMVDLDYKIPSAMVNCESGLFSDHIDACSRKRAMIFLATESKSLR